MVCKLDDFQKAFGHLLPHEETAGGEAGGAEGATAAGVASPKGGGEAGLAKIAKRIGIECAQAAGRQPPATRARTIPPSARRLGLTWLDLAGLGLTWLDLA